MLKYLPKLSLYTIAHSVYTFRLVKMLCGSGTSDDVEIYTELEMMYFIVVWC